MSAVRQIGIKMTVDAQSVTTELPKASREFTTLGTSAEQASARATRSLAQVQMSVRDIVAGAAGLHVIGGGINAITKAITELPRNAFDFSKNLEVSQVGMAGILGSMTAINGKQTDYNQALRISSEYIRKLNDDALRTAATSQELTSVFQALLAPGLSAKMNLEEIRQLTVVGTNAVKSMGLDATQTVQELRDLVAGGISAASSTLASALGLKDADIQKAKASSEGLFKFLMDRLEGFEASSNAFGDTLKGRLEQVKEGATRVAADGMEPLILASKEALAQVSNLFMSIDQGGKVTLNQELVDGIKAYATSAADALRIGQQWVGVLWENRDAALAVGAAWASFKLGGMVAETVAAIGAKAELARASRLAAVQAAAESAGNLEVAATSRQKVAAFLAELEAKAASARAEVAAQAAQIATLATTREAIVLSRAEVVAKLDAVRATMAQAEAQIAAARAAGAQSFALAALREGTQALTAAQARHAMLMTELATLGKQQAGVNAALATATAAQTAATNAASAAAGGLAAAQGAASIAGRALSGVVGFMGGPIGLVTTALTLGVTAWTLWGNSGSQAERKVAADVERSTPEIVAGLDKQIAKLQARNALVTAGLGDIAAKAGEDAERAARLQVQINNLQSGKGVDGGAPLPEAARVGLLQNLLSQYGVLVGRIRSADQEQTKLNQGTQKLSLTPTVALQAFEKTIDGAKTASAAQQEYTQKVEASRAALDALKASGADSDTLGAAQKKFDESEKAWAAERDKKIKEMGAGAASAHSHAIDAQIAAVQQGYKLLTAKTADALDELQALRQLDLVSEYDAVQRKAALQAQDMEAQRQALQAELALIQGKKESAKERANLEGQLAELEQKRINLERTTARDLQVLLVKPQLEQVNALRQSTAAIHDQAEALELQNRVYGQASTALIDLNIAQLEKQRLDLEATDNVIPGYIAQLEKQIAAQKRMRAAMAEKDSKDWAKEYSDSFIKANERVAEAAQREHEQVAQSLTDNIMRGGKDGGEYIEDLFRTMVLRPTIMAVMSPVAGVVSGVVNTGLSALGLAGNVASAANGAGALSGMGGLGGLGSVLGGVGTAASYGAQALFAGNGLGALSGGWGMLTSGGTAATMAQGAGMMAGVLGPIALGIAALTSIIGKTKGETRVGGQFGVAYDGEVYNQRRGQTYTYEGQQFDRDFSNGARVGLTDGQAYRLEGDQVANEQALRNAVAGTASTINDLLKGIGSSLSLTGFSAGLETSTKDRGGNFAGGILGNGVTFGESGKGDNYAGTLYELFSTRSPDFKTAVENFTLDLKQATLQSIQAAAQYAAEKGEEFPALIAKKFKGVDFEALTSEQTDEYLNFVNTQIEGVKRLRQAFDAMGMDHLAEVSFDVASGLAEVSGGFDNFLANLNNFYTNFVSADEQRANMQRVLQSALSAVNLTLPDIDATDARAQYAALVKTAENDMSEQGRKAYAALIANAGAFASITKTVESATDALDKQRDAHLKALERSVAAEKKAIQARLDAARDTAGAWESVFNLLHSNVREIRGEADATRAMLAREGNEFIVAALEKAASKGIRPDTNELAEAIAAARAGLDISNFGGDAAERDYAANVLAGRLQGLERIAGKQLTDAQKTVRELEFQTGQLDQEQEYWRDHLAIANNTYEAITTVAEAVEKLRGDFQTGTTKPGGVSTGGGGTSPAAGGGVVPRTSYGADEALTSFDKFKAWYAGIRVNADPNVFKDPGYQVPDWMRVHNGADDGTDKEQFGSYLFFKNNPQYAKDLEQIYSTGRSSYATDGSTLVRSDLSKMPTDVAEYYRNNRDELLASEGFGLDPVLAYQLYNFGPQQFGLDGKRQSFTEWLQTTKWTPEGLVANNNVVSYAQMGYGNYNLARWDTSSGNIVDVDGRMYTPDGKYIGNASRAQLDAIYGAGYKPTASVGRSSLYNSQVGGGGSEADYYGSIKTNLDKAIADGWSAQQLVDAVVSTGASLQDVANAYGISLAQVQENLRNGGATNIPQFRSGGSHWGGLRIVGEDGPELEATGPSRIWNQHQIADALGGGGSSAQLTSLLQALMTEVRLLRKSVDIGTAHSGDTAAALRDVKNGNSLVVEMAPSSAS